jgi:outer membrane protein insertion porin family/translocation and assembly module TamA
MRSRLLACALLALAFSAACKEEGSVTVHRLTFKGVKEVDEGKLKNALATRQSSIIPWGRKYSFDRSRFDADLKRIQAFYADRGYPDARVVGFDTKLNDKQVKVDITVTIEEGAPVKVAAIDLVGFDVIPTAHLAEMMSKVPLKVGAPRDRQLVVTTHEMAVNELKDHGFPYAKVATAEDDGPDGKHAKMTFTAEPGKSANFGSVEISGNKSVSERIIERELSFKPGDLYRRSIVQESQRRLYGMELFQFVNIEPLNPELQPEEIPTRVTVAEGKHHRVNFGIGYGTEEKGRVDAEYHHLNFLGGARTAGAHARWSTLDRGVRLDFNQPYFFAPHYSFGVDAQDWRTFTPAYNSTVVGAKAIVTHRRTQRTSWSVSIASEHDRSSIDPDVLDDPKLRPALIALGLDPTTGEQSGTLTPVGFDLQHSTTDNLLNAHHGYQLAFHTEEAGRLMPGTFHYYAISTDARYYVPIGDSIVFASRLQFGNLRPAGGDPANVPFAKKFFLGGATSLRGWGRFEVSPLLDGLPVGGNSMLEFSQELRAALRGNFGIVLFLDAGNVWSESFGVSLADLRYDVGPELRYQTAIGPIRFDLGYQLNPIPGLLINGSPQTRRYRLHFSIGQAF